MANSSIDFFKSQSKVLFKDYKTRYYNEVKKLYAYQPKYYDVATIFRSFDYPDQEPDFSFSLMNAQHLLSRMAGFDGWEKLIHVSDAELELAKPLLYKFRIGQPTPKVSEKTSNQTSIKALGGERAKNIKTFAILTAADPDAESVTLTYRREKKIYPSLSQVLPKLSFPIKGHNGNEECSFLIMNESFANIKKTTGSSNRTSFLFCQNGVLQYWEKQDVDKPYNSLMNKYVLKEEFKDDVEVIDKELFCLTGRNFQFSIPFSLFDSLSEKLQKNIDLYFKRDDKIVDVCMHATGLGSHLYRKQLYKDIIKIGR